MTSSPRRRCSAEFLLGSTGRGRREAEGGFGAKERLLLLDVGLTQFVVMWDETCHLQG